MDNKTNNFSAIITETRDLPCPFEICFSRHSTKKVSSVLMNKVLAHLFRFTLQTCTQNSFKHWLCSFCKNNQWVELHSIIDVWASLTETVTGTVTAYWHFSASVFSLELCSSIHLITIEVSSKIDFFIWCIFKSIARLVRLKTNVSLDL